MSDTAATKETGALEDMRKASSLVDYATSPAEYQRRLVALGLIARQYLRVLATREE